MRRLTAGSIRRCATSRAKLCPTTRHRGGVGTVTHEVEATLRSRLLPFCRKESRTMLFYIKRYLSLEIVVTLLLGGLCYLAIRRNGLPLNLRLTPQVIALGLARSLWLTLWALVVQYGCWVGKGEAYS